jgi:stage II sporulation protein GA (sporulation sigma-E factor processing peptidase)
MERAEVYADVTFLINFIMDFVILWATARLARITPVIKRIAAAAFLGGIYAVGSLIPQLAFFYSFPLKVVFSCLMLFIGLPIASWDSFKKIIVFFYGINFTVAGATIAVSYMIDVNTLSDYSMYFWLFGGLLSALLIGIFGGKYLSTRIIPNLLKFKVEMRFEQKVCTGQGFLDTGNSLKDPLTNKPVIVAEYDWLRNCLPDDFKQAMETNLDEEHMLDELIVTSWSNRLRLIPFTSIGKKNGMLVGIRADEVKVDLGQQNSLFKNIVIGIYRGKLTNQGQYQMLVPAEIVESG